MLNMWLADCWVEVACSCGQRPKRGSSLDVPGRMPRPPGNGNGQKTTLRVRQTTGSGPESTGGPKGRPQHQDGGEVEAAAAALVITWVTPATLTESTGWVSGSWTWVPATAT